MSHGNRWRWFSPWYFLFPFLVVSSLLIVWPTLVTAGLAFTDFNAVSAPVWVGLDNFLRLAQSEIVRTGLVNSGIFVALAVPLRTAGALGMALLLRGRERPFGVLRGVVYLPTVIPEAAYALIWLWILNPVYGPLNLLLGAVGLPAINWLTDPVYARLGMVILATFQIGEGFVLLLAARETIAQDVYEAAAIDGADRWRAFRYITMPLLLPWLLLLVGRDLLVSLQNTFAPSFIITYGGPYYATTFVPLLVYEMAFDFLELGMAAALLLFVLLVTGLITLAITDFSVVKE
ncbi:MAG: sugar ABC transporter permease [Ardenticatenaceae bacterium]|nr:sugar ABC transporter permease [Ardenticatenaceae bacterium]